MLYRSLHPKRFLAPPTIAVLVAGLAASGIAGPLPAPQDSAETASTGAVERQPPAVNLAPLEPGLYAIFDTYYGVIVARLFDQLAPLTVQNFVGLATGRKPWLDPDTGEMVQRPLYENITFHRVIPFFMVQTGDPTGVGNHDCGFTIPDEIRSDLTFDRPGRLAMANLGKPGTAACQFFITEQPDSSLDGGYAIFGQVITGQDVVAKLARVLVDQNDKPRARIMLYSVRVIRKVQPAAPEADSQ